MKLLNRNHLKYIAVIAMLIDHFAHYFLSDIWGTPLYITCRFIGRLTAPIMCFFLVEGFIHTSSKKKYFLRLLIFAVISQVAFDFVHKESFLSLNFSMIYTLLCCFSMLWVMDSLESVLLKVLSVIPFVFITRYGDWGSVAPFWVLGFYLFKKNIFLQLIPYLFFSGYKILEPFIKDSSRPHIATLMVSGLLVFIPLILFYNGKAGKKNVFNKWFFYIIYPLHLFLIGIIKIATTL